MTNSFSLSCSATHFGWPPCQPLSGQAEHPVLQMWGALQGRGAASPGQPLPHKVLHLQGSVVPSACLCELADAGSPKKRPAITSQSEQNFFRKLESVPVKRIPHVQ